MTETGGQVAVENVAPAPPGDDVVVFHPDELTINEQIEVEKIAGQPIGWLYSPDKPTGELLRAITYVVCRRDNPNFTLDDAGHKRAFIRVTPVPPTSGSG